MIRNVRRRLMAPVAAIGLAIAMSVTAPLARADAAEIVHALPAAPPGAPTAIFHARAASGTASTLASPIDITCYFQMLQPFVQGGRTDSSVWGSAGILCLFDIDGSTANVQHIDLTVALSLDNQIVDIRNVQTSGDYIASADVLSVPCRHGVWTSSATVRVDFPAGYTPPSDFESFALSTTLNLGDCPNDYVEVPEVTGFSLSRAQTELFNAGLVGKHGGDMKSCEFAKGTIARQAPEPGRLVLPGSTVLLNRSSGRPSTPCP